MRTIALAFLPSSMAVFRPSEVYSISSLIPKSRPYSRNSFLFSLCSIFISFRLSWFIVFLCAYDSSYYRSMSSGIFRLCEYRAVISIVLPGSRLYEARTVSRSCFILCNGENICLCSKIANTLIYARQYVFCSLMWNMQSMMRSYNL